VVSRGGASDPRETRELRCLRFEEFSLQGSIRLTDEDLAALTDDAMPGNAFSGGSRGHGAPGAACAPGQAQAISQGPHKLEPFREEFVARSERRDPRTFESSSKQRYEATRAAS